MPEDSLSKRYGAKILPKEEVINLLQKIYDSYDEIYANTGERYEKIECRDDLGKVKLRNPRPYTSAKKIFFLPTQELFGYRKSNGDWEIEDYLEKKRIAILGMCACDVRGLQRLDLYFKECEDPYYWERRNNSFIVGSTCLNSLESCFCNNFGGLSNEDLQYDLWITDIGRYYLIEVGSEEGMKFVEGLEDASAEHFNAKERIIREIEAEMGPVYSKEKIVRAFSLKTGDILWRELKERCLACGKCNFVCPSCHCFTIYDDISLDGNEGKRIRKWDSCHLWTFAVVAGRHNFREDLESRVRYRIYDKFYYPYERYGVFQCVGCGRCYDVCSADIDLREVLRRLVE